MIITGIGHRPDKLKGWSYFLNQGKDQLKNLIKQELLAIQKQSPIEKVICGMAMGFDYCLGVAALELDIPVHAYVPFQRHHLEWGENSQVLYGELVAKATERTIVSTKKEVEDCGVSAALYKRSIEMVKASDLLIVLLDPTITSGGAYHCFKYALSTPIKIHTIWDKWNTMISN